VEVGGEYAAGWDGGVDLVVRVEEWVIATTGPRFHVGGVLRRRSRAKDKGTMEGPMVDFRCLCSQLRIVDEFITVHYLISHCSFPALRSHNNCISRSYILLGGEGSPTVFKNAWWTC